MAFVIKRTKTGSDATTKYIKNVQNAGDDWLNNYKEPKRDPRAAAVAAKDKWWNQLTAARSAGRFEKNVGKYNVDDAIATATAVGKDHYVTGAVARGHKVLTVQNKLETARKTILAHVDAMPTATLQERLAKSAYFATEMAKLKGTFKD